MRRRFLFVVALTVISGCAADSPSTGQAAAQNPAASEGDFRPQPSGDGCGLCAETNPLLVVDKDGNASGTLRLRNRGTDPLILQLSVSDFTAPGDGAPHVLNAVTTLAAVDSAAEAIVGGKEPLAPGVSIDVKVSAANLWQAGPSAASLLNGTQSVVDLKALRYNVPFNLKVDGQTPERADLTLTRNRESHVTLRNDDPMTYRFRWYVEIDGITRDGLATVLPYKTVALPVKLSGESFTWLSSGTLRGDTRPGVLTLEHLPHESLRNYPLSVRRYPIAAQLTYWHEPWQGLFNSLSILILLLLGIAVSLLINFVLPLQKTRVAVKQRLYDLEGRLAGLDEVVDPIDRRFLSQMRIEKKRLRSELRALLPIFPQSAVDLPRLEERLTHFTTRIDWVSQVGGVLQSLQRRCDIISTEEAEQIGLDCREILGIAAKEAALPEEVAEVAQRLLQATSAVNPDQEIPAALLERLQRNVKELRARIGALANKPTLEPFATLLASFESALPPESPADGSAYKPGRAEFIRHETTFRQAALVVAFVRLVEHAPDDSVRDGRWAQRERLLSALQPGPDASLSRAEEIVDQANENVYPQDVVEEITRGAVYVDVDPPRPLPYQLTEISLRFHRPGVDRAAARKEIVCEWTINKERVPSTHWSVTYFLVDQWRWLTMVLSKLGSSSKPDHFPVHVTLKERGSDAVLRRLQADDIALEKGRSSVEAQTWLSVGSLVITLLVIGFGLASGAEEKLRSLDFVSGAIAVFVLGFGADALKTLISRNSG